MTAFICSLIFGAVALSVSDLLAALDIHNPQQSSIIIWQLRFPRAILAMCVGVMLAMSGAITQGLFRNPLADPSLIGVTAGALAGATIVIVLGNSVIESSRSEFWQSFAMFSMVSVGAFLGGMITVLLVYRLATSPSGTSVSTMLLAGIAITALAGSLTSLLEYSADNQLLRQVSLWRMGAFGVTDSFQLAVAIVFALIAVVCFPRYAQALNLLLLGESEARHLGVNVERLKRHLIFWVALVMGVSVALVGPVAFVGLVVPHIVRLLVGPDHRRLVILTAVVGAGLMLVADCVSRVILAPAEVPVGVITALIGAPFFIALLRARAAGLGVL